MVKERCNELRLECERLKSRTPSPPRTSPGGADLMLRQGESWMARKGQREQLTADEPESTPVASFLDTILNGAPDREAGADGIA